MKTFKFKKQKLENKNLFNFGQKMFFLCSLVFIFGFGFCSQVDASWTAPIGIPEPSFGINETHQMYAGRTFDFGSGPEPYKDAGNGPYTHYVDNTSPAAIDSDNPFGTPNKPRVTFPGNLPPGSVVEVHGGPYNFRNFSDKMAVWGYGTASSPIFFRGISSSQRPLFTKDLIVMGSYIVLENLEFYIARISFREFLSSDIHHISLRNLEMHSGGTEGGSSSVIAIGVPGYKIKDIVVYNNHIHDYGTLDTGVEADWHGVKVSGTDAINVWVVDNHIHHMGGDSIQAGNNANNYVPPYTSHHLYIGRNLMHDNGENAVDIKLMSDVVVSQNRMYNFVPSSSDDGTAFVVHYSPLNVWLLFNEIYNASVGVRSTGVGDDLYLLGNVVHDVSNAILFWGGGRIHIIGNTIVRVDHGITNGGGSADTKPIINNIITDIKDLSSGYHISYDLTSLSDNSDMHHNLLFQDGGSIRIKWRGKDYTSVAGFQASTGKGAGSTEANPLFVSPSSNNFQLTSGSPAIDAGSVHEVYATFFNRYGIDIVQDIAGLSRPVGTSWDIGAYEYIVVDTTAPILSLGAPSGNIPTGTTQTTLSLTTNENATCKYGTTPNTIYASIPNTFTTTNGTTHSQAITNLTNGTTYKYYVRCKDTLNNSNTADYLITFSINTPQIKPSDLNQDGKVDSTDFSTLTQDWNKTTKPPSDLNQDGIVDSRDFGIMMSNWN